MNQLTTNFYLAEFQSHDGAEMPDKVKPNIQALANELQVLRDFVGEPVRVLSGYRSPSHNKAVGGVRNSQHVKGNAADIIVRSKSPQELYDIIEELIEKGKMKQGGLGLYPSFVHYDIRGTKVRW